MSEEIKQPETPIVPQSAAPEVKKRSFNSGIIPGELHGGNKLNYQPITPPTEEEIHRATLQEVGKLGTGPEFLRWKRKNNDRLQAALAWKKSQRSL